MSGNKKGEKGTKPKFNYYVISKGTKPINRPKQVDLHKLLNALPKKGMSVFSLDESFQKYRKKFGNRFFYLEKTITFTI